MIIERQFNECILRPEDLEPSRPELEVVSAFNPGAVEIDGEVVLMVRVAERPRCRPRDSTGLPRWELQEGPVIDWVEEDLLEPIDPRMVRHRREGHLRLTFTSHIRTYRSPDGRTVDLSTEQLFVPRTEFELFGVEDPRITRIADRFWITYVAVSEHGPATALASTTDFRNFERHGIIFCPENKDVVFFPETFGDDYLAIHRPNPQLHFSPPGMWLATSADMLRWGRHRPLHVGSSEWETGRIGAGPPPLRTTEGWMLIYHGKAGTAGPGEVATYSAGLIMLDRDDPTRIIGHAPDPIMVPEAAFETQGFVPSVVFPTGIVRRNDRIQVYYGAADTSTGLVEYELQDLLTAC